MVNEWWTLCIKDTQTVGRSTWTYCEVVHRCILVCRLILFSFKSFSSLWKCRNPFRYVIVVLNLNIHSGMMALRLVNPSIKEHWKVTQYGCTQNFIYGVTNNTLWKFLTCSEKEGKPFNGTKKIFIFLIFTWIF